MSIAGRLLLASPEMRDPNFVRSVVLILEHHDDGALGVVVDRPLDIELAAHLPAWAPHVSSPGMVFAGGPVQREAAIGLAWRPNVEPFAGWQPVLGGVGLIDLSMPPDEVVGVDRLRVFAGYAGWGAGQLELELTVGSWIVVDAEPSDPFDPSPRDLWQRVLRRQPGSTAFYANYPADIRAN